MVEWLAGNRIRGTNTERIIFPTATGISKASGGWKEVGRLTVGTAGKSIDVSGLDNKRYYMILTDAQVTGGTMQMNYRIGTGSYSNSGYGHRRSDNWGTDATVQGNDEMPMENLTSAYPRFTVSYMANLTGKFKLEQGFLVADSASYPEHASCVNKWSGTTVINQIQAFTEASGNFAVGAELVILGYDPADTHTTNFWEELGTVSGDGSTDALNVNIAAKKYLWVQYYLDPAASYTPEMRFNGSTASEYTNSYSNNGGGHAEDGTAAGYYPSQGGERPQFNNMFIMNRGDKSKLCMNTCVYQGDVGINGSATTPDHIESVGKWANNSQITSIKMESNGNNSALSTSSFMKVWGSN